MANDEQRGPKLSLVPGSPLQTAEHLPRYVRVTERLPNGIVAFDFAVGTPDMFVELILPEASSVRYSRRVGKRSTLRSPRQKPLSWGRGAD